LACAENNGCVGFAYILRDIATLFVSVWQSFVPSADDFVQRTSASEFVSKLILLTPYEGDESKSLILKTNLAFVKSLVEKWRALLQLSKDPISQLLRSGAGKPRLENSDRTNVQTGLQLLGLLVAQNFPLCDERVDAHGTAEVLFDLLVLRLKGSSKPLYEASSDVVGMILSNEGSQFSARLTSIRDLMLSFGMSKEVDKFLRCTQKISSFFPSFLNRRLVSQVVSLSINIHGEPLEFAVKIICQYAAQFQKFKQTGFPANEDHYEVDMFVPEIRPCVPNTLRSKNPAAQIVILEMLQSHLSNELSGQDLEAWLPHVCTLCEENSNVGVRTLGFQWLMWAYDNRLDRLSSTVAEQVRSALLCGLKDSAASVQQLLFAFWDHSTRLSDSLDIRFQASLQRLHNPKHEQDWVSNCSALLLAPCTRTPMYSQPFSPRPLKVRNDRAEDIEMSDIGGDMEMQDTMVPLFSRSSQSQRTFNSGSQHTDSLGSFVPMTQYQWSQTQMVEGSQADQRPSMTTAANLMQSFDIDRMVFSQDMGGGAAFNIGSQLSQQRPSSSQVSANPAAAGANSESQLCRRFAKRESGKVLAMRFADERARMNRIFAERQQQQKRQAKVDLLRRYRTGEVPDIEIKHSELIQPLLNLQSEPQIAVITLMMLYESFFGVLVDSKLLKKDEVVAFKTNLRNGIFQLLQASPCVSTDFVTVLQRMCVLLEPDIKELTAFPVQLITDTALRSQSSATAVLLLEQHLPRCEPRTKKDDSTRQSLVLSQLARLYSTLGDSDMVLGVYERACTQTITKEAIALTYQQDFSAALNRFEQASDWAVEGGHQWEQVANPPQFEVDIWERERMECFRRLGQWNNVAENVLINVDNDPVQLWQPTPDRDFSTRLLLDASLHNSKYQDQAMMLVDHVQADREVLESVGGAALVLLESIKRPNRAPMAGMNSLI
jgi:DNA-dependent protein kinase catalytic subunit